MSDAEAVSATRRVEDTLAELRALFPLRSLDADGVVLFRCYESLARMQVGEIKWRAQIPMRLRQQDSLTPVPAQLPAGYYAHLVASITTKALTAEEVRVLGERELSRIHQDIRALMATLGERESLKSFFDFLRSDERFFYPDTTEGREDYLADVRRTLTAMQARLDEVVMGAPNVPLIIRGTSEPDALTMYAGGEILIPLADMRTAPKYLLQAIAYHEGVPGHHLQFAIQRGKVGAPMSLAAQNCQTSGYGEGWAFYAERLPYELGMYTDPYSNAGRLGMEAWRAARAIVDVRVNVDGWSDEQAVAFLLDNTPLPEPMARGEVRRFRRTPSRATAYLIGELAIEQQRERAAAALGPRFDVRLFHEQVLRHGPMPLAAIEDLVERWIQSAAR
jgi:uncharacterized protein (DUF885 family)